tara:strand:- start:5429 stop:5674 length:246 start_codon:yes stop_codon:yes gene_type:complete
MTEFKDVVYKQRQLLLAEEWALGVSSIHAHSLSSMHYDDRPEDTANGEGVIDTEFNNGLIERKKNGQVIHYFGTKLEGDDL